MADHVLVWMVCEEDDSVLLVRRKQDHPPFAGCWLLPGGEMRAEESTDETIARTGKGELDIQPSVNHFDTTLILTEGGDEFVVNLFRIRSYLGRARFRESGPYEDARWVPRGEVATDNAYASMPPALREHLASAT